MCMHGGDGCSGPIFYGRAREEGVGVITRAQVMIFVNRDNSKKTACTKRSTQTSQEKYNQGEKKFNQDARHQAYAYYQHQRKNNTTKRGRNTWQRPNQHEQETRPTQATKIATCYLCVKKAKSAQEKTVHQQNDKAIHSTYPNNMHSGGKWWVGCKTPAETTMQKRS